MHFNSLKRGMRLHEMVLKMKSPNANWRLENKVGKSKFAGHLFHQPPKEFIMKFNFKSQKAESADAPKREQRDSLAAFKAKADAVLAEDTLNKITGGRFSDCHCHCHSAKAL
jgi:hypothetical protein